MNIYKSLILILAILIILCYNIYPENYVEFKESTYKNNGKTIYVINSLAFKYKIKKYTTIYFREVIDSTFGDEEGIDGVSSASVRKETFYGNRYQTDFGFQLDFKENYFRSYHSLSVDPDYRGVPGYDSYMFRLEYNRKLKNDRIIGIKYAHFFDRPHSGRYYKKNIDDIMVLYNRKINKKFTYLINSVYNSSYGNLSNEGVFHFSTNYVREYLPEKRKKFSVTGMLSIKAGKRHVIHISGRMFACSWKMFSSTAAFKYYWLVGKYFTFRINYRFHIQKRAYFWGNNEKYYTNNYKYDNLITHSPGINMIFYIGKYIKINLKSDYYYQNRGLATFIWDIGVRYLIPEKSK